MQPTESAKELLELLSAQKEKQGRDDPEISQKLVDMLLARPVLTSEEMLARLKRAFELLQEKHELKIGQIVKWKQGLLNKRLPKYGDPAIVIEVLEKPVFDESNDAGTPYFREKLDVVLALLDKDGDCVSFHFDSRRFEPWS
jgi:hypothetical protein